jgi:glucosylceramidase
MNRSYKRFFTLSAAVIFLSGFTACSKGGSSSAAVTPTHPDTTTTVVTTPVQSDVQYWLTNGDQSALLAKQNQSLVFKSTSNAYSTITVDSTQSYQSIDGFGYALTGGSAYLINRLDATTRDKVLRELFSADSTAIGVSYIRISIGASDLNASVFSYDDIAVGQTDTSLQYFSLDPDKYDLIPILQKIVTINPSIKIIATPWSAPVWMKTNGSTIGGSLQVAYYKVYANYFVKYIKAMQALGIPVDAITPQNEPMNPNNNPSMTMSASEEADFIKGYLGPAFQSTGISTRIIIFDHNCGNPEYPLAILADVTALPYVDGSAFHLYGGDISALSQVHNAAPSKNVYFTEQWVGGPSNFPADLSWAINNLVIGATRNWSKNVLEWNLANDPNYQPHTPGGCGNCLGALTIGTDVTRNVSYYIIAHASKFVMPNSVRIASNISGNLQNVAFLRPDGKKVLIVLNNGSSAQNFNISFNNKIVTTSLNANAVATYVW